MAKNTLIKLSSISDAKTVWNPTNPLPPELFRNVISFLESTQDLLTLCVTSKLCRTEAERLLYHTIDLAEDSETPTLWARTIVKNPPKALLVRSLTIRFDLSFLIVPSLVLPSMVLISKALREVRNLKALRLFGHSTAMMPPLCSWLLDGCTLNLHIFENEVLPPSSVLPFISKQKELRNWVQAGVFKQAPPDDFLPLHITDLEIHASALQGLIVPRSLERLHLTIDHTCATNAHERERETIKSLGIFSETLTSLAIDHKIKNKDATNHIQPSEVLSLLAEQTPNLTFLSYQTTPVYICPAFNPLFPSNAQSTHTASQIPPSPHLSHLPAHPPPPASTRANLISGQENQDRSRTQTQYLASILQFKQMEALILPLPPLPSGATGNRTKKHLRKSSVRNIADGILGASDSIQELSFVGDQKEYTFVKGSG